MTKLPAEAFKKASELPDELQDELTERLLLELAWESRWDETLAQSQDLLGKMADQALADHRAGRTLPRGIPENSG